MSDWKIQIFHKDRRFKSGEKIFDTLVYTNRSEEFIKQKIIQLLNGYPITKFRIEYNAIS